MSDPYASIAKPVARDPYADIAKPVAKPKFRGKGDSRQSATPQTVAAGRGRALGPVKGVLDTAGRLAGATGATIQGATQGLLMNSADELLGAVPFVGKTLERSYRAAEKDAQRRYPAAYWGGQIGGAVVSPVNKVGVPAKGAALGAKMVAGARAGAGQGAAAGFFAGEAPESRLGGAATGAAAGGFLGGVAPLAGRFVEPVQAKLSQLTGGRIPPPAAASRDAGLRAGAQVRNVLADQGINTPADLKNALAAKGRVGYQEPEVFDVLGERGLGKVRGLALINDDARGMVRDQTARIGARTRDDMLSAVDQVGTRRLSNEQMKGRLSGRIDPVTGEFKPGVQQRAASRVFRPVANQEVAVTPDIQTVVQSRVGARAAETAEGTLRTRAAGSSGAGAQRFTADANDISRIKTPMDEADLYGAVPPDPMASARSSQEAGRLRGLVDEVRATPEQNESSVIAFIRRFGGIKDDRGDVAAILGQRVPGVLNKNGQSADDIALYASERGMFPWLAPGERGTSEDLFRLLDDDLRGLRAGPENAERQGAYNALNLEYNAKLPTRDQISAMAYLDAPPAGMNDDLEAVAALGANGLNDAGSVRVGTLDAIRAELQAMESKLYAAGNSNAAGAITTLRQKLTSAVSEQSPEYREALAVLAKGHKDASAIDFGAAAYGKGSNRDLRDVQDFAAGATPRQARLATNAMSNVLRGEIGASPTRAANALLDNPNGLRARFGALAKNDPRALDQVEGMLSGVGAARERFQRSASVNPYFNSRTAMATADKDAAQDMVDMSLDAGALASGQVGTFAGRMMKRMVNYGIGPEAEADIVSLLTNPSRFNDVMDALERNYGKTAANQAGHYLNNVLGIVAGRTVGQGVGSASNNEGVQP